MRAIFVLPDHYPYRSPLAYIEYFTPFTTQRPNVDMFLVKRLWVGGKRDCAVISVESIRCSCHLIPVFGKEVILTWMYEDVLERCSTFYVNSYLDADTFQFFIG